MSYRKLHLLWTTLLILLCSGQPKLCSGQLVINVKNQGGDVLQETIFANTTDDTVTLEFQRPEGTLITQFIEFKSGVQIFKALVLGEEERGQSQYQVMCFVIRYPKNEFISSDAMSKLRQKNPGTIRQPEEDKGKEQQDMDLFVTLDMSSVISHHIKDICAEAGNATYAKEADLKVWANPKGTSNDIVALAAAVKRFPPDEVISCKDTPLLGSPCYCKFEVCVGWYPCGLKYCKGKDTTGKVVNYRCGIKTCRKCRTFTYYVYQKQMCLWDE